MLLRTRYCVAKLSYCLNPLFYRKSPSVFIHYGYLFFPLTNYTLSLCCNIIIHHLCDQRSVVAVDGCILGRVQSSDTCTCSTLFTQHWVGNRRIAFLFSKRSNCGTPLSTRSNGCVAGRLKLTSCSHSLDVTPQEHGLRWLLLCRPLPLSTTCCAGWNCKPFYFEPLISIFCLFGNRIYGKPLNSNLAFRTSSVVLERTYQTTYSPL